MKRTSVGGVAPINIVVTQVEMSATHLLDVVSIWAGLLSLLTLEISGTCRQVLICLNLRTLWGRENQMRNVDLEDEGMR